MQRYRGACHCGRIVFEAEGELRRVLVCNCSICTKKGYLHWILPRSRVRLLTPADNWTTYRFHTRTAAHRFCPVCGVAPFYVPRSDPDCIDVNARCLEDVDLGAVEREPFDGRNWEQALRAHRARRGPGQTTG